MTPTLNLPYPSVGDVILLDLMAVLAAGFVIVAVFCAIYATAQLLTATVNLFRLRKW